MQLMLAGSLSNAKRLMTTLSNSNKNLTLSNYSKPVNIAQIVRLMLLCRPV